ncbi:MAG TPA: amino acid adenylation domain-containing protein, partial [Herpetosiphonaceae bacterium]
RLRIPADYPRPQQPTFRGGTIAFTLSGEISSALQQLSRRTGVTLFMTLLSAFQVLLGRYARQDDVVVGTSVAKRHRTQLEDLIGFFVNTLVLRSDLAGDPTFQQLLGRVRSVVLDAFTHQDLPFAALVEALQPQRNLSLNPLFQVFFVLQTAPIEPLALPELEMTPLDLQGSTAMFDLLLSMEETEHGLRGALEYNSDLFEPSTITRMIRRFGYLLEQIVQQPHAPISALDLDPALVLPPVAPAADDRHDLPLSPHQERLWFVDQFETGNVYAAHPIYHNLPLILRLRGPIDQRALEHSLHAVIERHSALRTTIVSENADRRQVVHADARLTLSLVECGPEAALERALDEARQPFALDGEPLIRATLLRVSVDEALLVLVVHHIVADQSSLRVIAQELVAIYRARITGRDPQLPPVLLQYGDYVAWQHALPADAIEQLLFFWKRRLGGRVQALELPENRPRPAIHTFTAASQQFTLPGSLLRRMQAVAQEENWSDFALLLAGFKALLHRYARQSEIVVGTTVDARKQLGLEQTVGPIANLVVLRSQVSGELTFRALLAQLSRTIEQALAHQALPFDRLVQELKPEQDMGRTALFDVLFQLDDQPPLLTTGGGSAEIVETNLGYGKYDLNLALTRGHDAITGSLVYNADIYDAWIIAQMVEHFQVLLTALIADRDRRIADVDLLSAAEVQQQRVAWNATDAQYPADLTVDQLFAAQVARTPANIAVRDGAEQITYGELDARANQLAHLLLQQGVGPDTLVALCFERSIDMIVALLAVLKAGGAYLPLEPSYPEDRLRFMVEDTRVAHLVTTRDLLARVPAPVAAVILIDEQRATIAAQPRTAPPATAAPSNLMYCIYTSGSTGIPKGVLLEHRNVVRLVLNDRHPYAFGEHDVWSMFHSYCFDVSVWEMYGALLYGGTLVIVPAQVAKDPVAFVDLLIDHRVTILSQTPTAFSYVAKEVLKRAQTTMALRYVIFAGEALDPIQLQAWHERYPAVALINMYGITETTVHSTFKLIAEQEIHSNISNIGRPIPTTTMYLMDDRQQLLPVGVAGEIYVGGAGVARGYLRRPELTAQRFVPDPFNPGERLYRSGDIAKLLPDGEMVYLGRGDDQVQIRGFRVELGEIQTRLLKHPAVSEAAVIAHKQRGDTPELFAYVVLETNVGLSALRRHLAETLPHYMVPTAFMVLPALPLTSNGKLDRRALPLPDTARPDLDTAYVASRSSTEALLVGIWTTVLGLDAVGVHDDFFALGGHSLLATQLMSRVRDTFDVDLPLHHLFEAPTPAALAERVEAATQQATGLIAPPILPAADSEIAPLSFAQQRLWFLDQLEPGNASYSIPAAFHIRGPLNRDVLHQSLNTVIARHAALRTTFVVVDGQPRQVIAPELPLPLLVVDLQHVAEPERMEEMQRRVQALAEEPFDLQHGPLLRATLLILEPENVVLVFVMHHIISDGWSIGILIREITACYAALSTSHTPDLPPLRIQYADYAVWQRDWLQNSVLETQLSYWRARLGAEGDSLPALNLPTDYPRPARQTFRGRSHSFALSPDLSAALVKLGQREGATLFMTLLAAFQVVLSRFSGQDDLAVGTPIANRHHIETESLIGCFVNTLVLRTDLSGNPTFVELLGRVRAIALGAYAHQDLPFEQLVEALQPARDLSRHPLISVLFALQNMPVQELAAPGLRLQPIEIETTTTKFDLSCALWEADDRLQASITYGSDLFAPATIERIAEYFELVLVQVAADPTQRVASMPLLTATDQQRLLKQWHTAPALYPEGGSIHRLFEAQAARRPDAVAVVYEEQQISYAELNRRANQLARHLQSVGVRPESRVGLLLHRSTELIVGLLAILKAGGAYVPLEPALPAERLAFMLEDAQVEVLIADDRTSSANNFASRSSQPRQVVNLDADAATIQDASGENLIHPIQPEQLAYVIYTSGSTGTPKGVAVEHRQLVNYVYAVLERLAVPPGSSFATVSTFAADLGHTAIFPALCQGGCLHVIAQERASNPQQFADYMQRHAVDCLKIVPSHLGALLSHAAPEQVLPRQRLILGGEALRADILAKIQALPGTCQVVNHYGPTETTVGVLAYMVPANLRALASGAVPLGRPLGGIEIYLLNARLEPVPIGAPGELYVGGAAVSRGYLNQPALTASRFVPNPFTHAPGSRFYRTGDLARFLPDGTIEFLGRSDQQVKLRGFRIETGEIAAVLAQHPAVREAAVLVWEDQPASGRHEDHSSKRLVAYVVENQEPRTENLEPNEQSRPEGTRNKEQVDTATPPSPVATGEGGRGDEGLASSLREFLARRLPDYMLPTAFVTVPALPLTPNGKLDRRALPAPEQTRVRGEPAAPRTELEQTLRDIWQDVLRVEAIGIYDNFFELGGDSILSIQIIARASQAGIHLTVRQMFEAQTIAELAAVANTAPQFTIDQSTVTGPVLLTPIQRWFWEQQLAEPQHWNQAVLLETRAPLNRESLAIAVQHLLLHHDALRMRFAATDAGWQQSNASPDDDVPLSHVDLADVPLEQQAAALEAAATEIQASLNLQHGPLLRIVLFTLGADRPGRLLIVIHHLVIDGVSWRILLEDLQTAYQQAVQREPLRLLPKTTSFQEWAARLSDFAQRPERDAERAYWLAPERAQVPALPLDDPGGANTGASMQQISVVLDADETQTLLRDVPRAYRTQINDLLLTALAQTLADWAGHDRVLVDLEGHGRETLIDGVDLSRTVGWFTTHVPVVLKLGAQAGPADALIAIKEQLRRIPNHGIGYGLLRYLRGDARLAEQLVTLPQPQVAFNYLGQFDQVLPASALLGPAFESSGPAISPRNQRSYALVINALIIGGQLHIDWMFSGEMLYAATVERLAQRFVQTLRQLIDHCMLPESGQYTPSDFPDVELTQAQIGQILAEIPRAAQNVEAIYQLAPAQQGMLFETVTTPGSGVHIEQLTSVLIGSVDPAAFEQAWQQIVDRHPILRTTFAWQSLDVPVQVVLQSASVSLERQNWQNITPDEQQERLAAYLDESRAQGFDLAQAPLLRFALFQMAPERYQFVWTRHHILLDGWCQPIILEEFLQTYRALSQGQAIQLTPRRPYRDYIAWLQHQDLAQAQGFWETALQDVQVPTALGIPGDAAVDPTARYGDLEARLAAETTHALQAMARQRHLTLNTLVQGAWAVLLSRYSGQEDVTFGITVSGRPADLARSESMLGLFINTLPLRVATPRDVAVQDWLSELQSHNLSLRAYEYCTAGQIHQWSGVPGTTPLYESLLVFENYPINAALEHTADLALTLGEVQTRGAQTHHALTVLVNVEAELMFRVIYDARRFDESAAQTIAAHLLAVLEQMVADARQPLQALIDHIPAQQIPIVRRLVKEERQTAQVLDVQRTVVEDVLADIWTDVLGITQIDRHDNFFALGGHSLLATQVVSRIRQKFEIELPLRSLFEAQTLAELASVIEDADKEARGLPVPPLVRVERTEYLPLSFGQQRMWFLNQLVPDSPFYNTPTAAWLLGTLDIEALARSLNEVVRRHENLRTTFRA